MTKYRIWSSAGMDLGTYEADSKADALDAMARDAGYADYADLLARVPDATRDDVEVVTQPESVLV